MARQVFVALQMCDARSRERAALEFARDKTLEDVGRDGEA